MNRIEPFLSDSDNNEVEIDLRNLLAYILLKWKTIALCGAVCLALGMAASFLQGGSDAPVSFVLEDERAKLTEAQAEKVESLFYGRQIYQDYQLDLQDALSKKIEANPEMKDLPLLSLSYQIISRLPNLNDELPFLLLSEEDYLSLMEITSINKPEIRDRIRLFCVQAFDDYSNTAVDENRLKSYYCQIYIYGTSEEQCEKMFEVVDHAAKQFVSNYRAVDAEMMIQLTGKNTYYHSNEIIQQEINQSFEDITSIDKLLTMMNNQINNLSNSEKNYYNLLSKEGEQDEPGGNSISYKKRAFLGLFLGVFAGIGFYFLKYVFDGKVKTAEEIEHLTNLRVIENIFLPGKKNLFGSWAIKLTGEDKISSSRSVEMIVSELQLLANRDNYQSIYLICDSSDEHAYQMALLIQKKDSAYESAVHISVGNPNDSTAELKQLLSADRAVLCAELWHTPQKSIRQWYRICVFYQVHLLGSLAVRQCW